MYKLILLITSLNKKTEAFDTEHSLPSNWPCQWNEGVIPYGFDFFSMSAKRLVTVVRQGIRYLQQQICLSFEEHDPKKLARAKNITYLFYSYSYVLEDCCLPYFSKNLGRRLVLITPTCSLPAEIAHATLHGLGLTHPRHTPFFENKINALNFTDKCNSTLT